MLDVVRKTGVRQVVFLSIAGDVLGRPPWTCQHCAVKSTIEANLKDDRGLYKWTVLGPSLFFTNDERDFDHTTSTGVYAAPHGPIGCSRVDVKDIAEVCARVVADPGHFHVRVFLE